MRFRLIPLLAALAFVPAGYSAEAAGDQSTPKLAPAPKTPHIEVSGETTRLSNNLASSLSATLPKFQPPPPPVANTHVDPAQEEAVEIDDPEHQAAEGQPRNKIIRLPKMVVEGDRPPIFRDRDINTKKGLGKLAAKKYISALDKGLLNRFTIPLIGMTPEQRALQMYEEEERLQNIDDLKEDAKNARRAGDSAESKALMRETNRAYLRSGGMDWTLPKD